MDAIAPERLLVRRSLVARLSSDGAGVEAWASAAARLWLGEGLAGPSPAAGEIAAASVLQAVFEEIVAEHRTARPGLVVEALAEADRRGGDSASGIDVFGSAWQHPTFDRPAEALLVLGAQLANPALGGLRALFDGPELQGGAGELLRQLEGILSESEGPAEALSLPAELRAPAEACPGSLIDQLEWVGTRWGDRLSAGLRAATSWARDLRAEEATHRGGGPGEAPVLHFTGPGDDEEHFSRDLDWMPRVVLIARQTYVWLDQLATAYGRPIRRLDQVPDEELDRLAERGFTCLWLIGLWERSPASRNIKRRRGNAEAEASAYALRDYRIADTLGGEAAYATLRDRAWSRGIRLAADMVPNHMGLDSTWLAEHPDWFVSVPEPPFGGYRFEGPDLSGDSRIEVRLEDGYWNETDAAVVFQRKDVQTGETSYVYHGNDGTQMPWNDTAQLDFLKAEVREGVIQQILAVARRFPVIRFDAAMTLARQHVQRLWYPPPGEGGAIPSRSQHSVPDAVFQDLMPREFWREVVDRVATEAPDTLLLAEAFWMMEGYFVRTLGMHRVYNSAFMHMLRDEDNGKYRQSIKNVLEYSPAILERFVNFMNNPDEETAVEQFGKGDKYFGICTLLATLPGLPMFGHGQIEGFSEKYGMEYRKAYWDEEVDEPFVHWHEQVIFPLLQRRSSFSGVEHFALYDFERAEGGVDEDVFAYTNRGPGGERALVLYNNRFEGTSGRIRVASPVNVGAAAEPELERRELAGALGLSGDDGVIYGMRELRSGQWYLRRAGALRDEGLFVELGGYGCQVFVEWRELRGEDWAALADELGGCAVEDLDGAREALVEEEEEGAGVVGGPLAD